MRRLRRIALPTRALDALAAYQSALDRAVKAERKKRLPKVGERVEATWQGRRPNRAIEAVRCALRAMASGLERCMYCEDSHGCDVEHLYPKVPRPERTFVWSNLLWICAICNRQKNDAFDEAMLDPTVDDPFEHLALSLATGRYVAREGSHRGAATLRVMPRLASEQTLIRGRHNAVVKLHAFLRDYDGHRAQGRIAEADAIRRVVVEEPFSATFAALLRASKEPGAADVLDDDLLAVLSRQPEMYDWLNDADAARADAARTKIEALAKAIRIRRSSRKKRAPRA